MPTYRYRCSKCGDEFEQWQSFQEDPVRTHDDRCGGEVLRVLTPAGIVLKGSGFYKTDSRASNRERAGDTETKPKDGSGSGSEKPASPSSDSGGDSKGGDSKGGDSDSKGSEAKPSPTKTGDSSKSTAGAAKPT